MKRAIGLTVLSAVFAGCAFSPTSPTRQADTLLQDLTLEIVPNEAGERDVSVIAVTVGNPSGEVRHDIRVNLILPNGLSSFIAWGTDGSCANVLDNCNPGGILNWVIADLAPGERLTLVAPAEVATAARPPAQQTLSFAASMNWREGGGASAVATLNVTYQGDRPSPGSVRRHIAVTGKGLRVEVQASRSGAKSDSEFTVRLSVTNESSQGISGAALRFVVPQRVFNFGGNSVGGACYNILNNCYAGRIVVWDLGTVPPQAQRSFEVPISVTSPHPDSITSKQMPLCATAYGSSGSGGFSCTSVELSD